MRFFGLLIIGSVLGITFGSCNSANNEGKETKTDSVSTTSKDKIDYGLIGNQLLQNEKLGDLKIGLSITKTIELLGKPSNNTKPELWGADGEYHHTLIYKDKAIELDIVGESQAKQKIGMITIIKPCLLKTKENIGIGSSLADVKMAYKGSINPEFSNSNSIVAGTIYGGLIFDMESDKVEKIIIGATAE